MRKIFAYIVMVVTLVATMIFFVPGFKGDTNFAMEYTGGFEVLYKIKSETKDVNDNAVASTISDGMSKILDINGIDDSIITVEDGNYIRVNVTSKNQIISDEIRNLIQNPESYEITFRDANNTLLATGDEILKEVGASFSGESNYYGQPVIYLNIKDTQLLKEITSTVSSNTSDTHLVIWVGFEEGVDSYANIQTEASTAKKVIYNATVSEPLSDEVITVTGDYTEEAAKNTVNLINSGTYKYEDLEQSIIQIKSVKEIDAIKDRNMMFIALGISIFLVLIAMVVFFKLEGIYAIPTVIFSEFLNIFLFNKIIGVINPQVVGAFILSNVVLFALLFIILNKYKNVLKTSKSAIKAYRETYKKNGPIILDSCVTLVLLALVTYFLGNNAQHFAIFITVSSLATFVTLYLLQRFVMYLTCDCFNKNDKAVIVSNNVLNKEESTTTSENKYDIDSYTKPAFFGFTGLAVLGAIVILITALAFKAPFSFHGDAKNSSSLELIVNEEYFKSEAEVMEFFDQEEMSIGLKTIELDTKDNKYIVKVTSNDSFAKHESYIKEQLVTIFGENTDYEENYILYINDYNPSSLLITFKSTLYTVGMGLLVTAIYFALRYKYSYSLATITSILMTVVSMIAFFGLTRIPLNSSTVISISIVASYSLFMLVAFFTKIKEYMKDNKKLYLSYQERVSCFKNGRNSIILPLIVSTAILDIISLVTMFFDLSNFSMYIGFILGSAFALIYNLIFVPKVWLLFENKSDKRKKTFKNKNISKSKYRTLDEQVFIGVND